MSEARYSTWALLAVSLGLLILSTITLVFGMLIGYRWGFSSGQAAALLEPAYSEAFEFAHPSDPRMDEELEGEPDGAEGTAFLGITFNLVTGEIAAELGLDEISGALVVSVVPGSPAAEAGLQPGDVILRVNRLEVNDLHPLQVMIAGFRPGDRVRLEILREGRTRNLTVRLGAR